MKQCYACRLSRFLPLARESQRDWTPLSVFNGTEERYFVYSAGFFNLTELRDVTWGKWLINSPFDQNKGSYFR